MRGRLLWCCSRSRCAAVVGYTVVAAEMSGLKRQFTAGRGFHPDAVAERHRVRVDTGPRRDGES